MGTKPIPLEKLVIKSDYVPPEAPLVPIDHCWCCGDKIRWRKNTLKTDIRGVCSKCVTAAYIRHNVRDGANKVRGGEITERTFLGLLETALLDLSKTQKNVESRRLAVARYGEETGFTPIKTLRHPLEQWADEDGYVVIDLKAGDDRVARNARDMAIKIQQKATAGEAIKAFNNHAQRSELKLSAFQANSIETVRRMERFEERVIEITKVFTKQRNAHERAAKACDDAIDELGRIRAAMQDFVKVHKLTESFE